MISIIASLISVIGALTVLTNIIVEVLKKVTIDKMPTNILAVIVAEALSLVAYFAWASYNSLVIVWYWVIATVVIGFLVAYAAMFGFDKLKETLAKIEDLNM